MEGFPCVDLLTLHLGKAPEAGPQRTVPGEGPDIQHPACGQQTTATALLACSAPLGGMLCAHITCTSGEMPPLPTLTT